MEARMEFSLHMERGGDCAASHKYGPYVRFWQERGGQDAMVRFRFANLETTDDNDKLTITGTVLDELGSSRVEQQRSQRGNGWPNRFPPVGEVHKRTKKASLAGGSVIGGVDGPRHGGGDNRRDEFRFVVDPHACKAALIHHDLQPRGIIEGEDGIEEGDIPDIKPRQIKRSDSAAEEDGKTTLSGDDDDDDDGGDLFHSVKVELGTADAERLRHPGASILTAIDIEDEATRLGLDADPGASRVTAIAIIDSDDEEVTGGW
ncbi:hypothetical protein Q5752_002959 [Cryptotrichosporon argae]